jgi:hypothetical protein
MKHQQQIVRQAEYARMCDLSRARIGQSVRDGKIVLTPDGKIDINQIDNSVFLAAHSGQASSIKPKPGGMATGKKAKIPPADPDKSKAKDLQTSSILQKIRDGQARVEGIDAGEESNPFPGGFELTQEEAKISIRKNYYDALKSKSDAELKAKKIDEINGSIILREDVKMVLESIAQEIEKNFFSCIPQQAADICRDLGRVGFEKVVEDVLNIDNGRRIETVIKKTKELIKHKRMIYGAQIKEIVQEEAEE